MSSTPNRRERPRTPKLIRLYITHVLIGYAIAAAFVAMLLYFNVANLWHPRHPHPDAGLLAVFILWLSNGFVFAGVQFAIAVDEPQGQRR
ncbi:MAG: hypothetical protein U5K36_01550 [Roseovarius sp.]|nr:hypothetical protein [Roseovarius sp.]